MVRNEIALKQSDRNQIQTLTKNNNDCLKANTDHIKSIIRLIKIIKMLKGSMFLYIEKASFFPIAFHYTKNFQVEHTAIFRRLNFIPRE